MGGKRRLGSTARCADRLGPKAPCSSAAGWTTASSARSARACTAAAHPPSSACLSSRRPPLPVPVRGKFPKEQGRKKRIERSAHKTTKCDTLSEVQENKQKLRALSWDGRRAGLLRRGLGGREHRNQPQVRRRRCHAPTRNTAHTRHTHDTHTAHTHTNTHTCASTHATRKTRAGPAMCCSSTRHA